MIPRISTIRLLCHCQDLNRAVIRDSNNTSAIPLLYYSMNDIYTSFQREMTFFLKKLAFAKFRLLPPGQQQVIRHIVML